MKNMIAVNTLITAIVGAAVAGLIFKYQPAGWTAVRAFGACLLLVGFVLWTTARFQLGGSFAVTAQAKQLVTRGLYSKIRNPIYIFGSCVIAGLILVVGRPKYLLIFLLVVPLQIWRMRKETSVLEQTFGEEYRRYRAGTWF